MESTPANHGLSRRDALKVGGAALALAVTGSHGAAAPAEAQTPKRGGVLRLTVQADPLHFDPHQTISFVTMVPLSLVYSRLVKVKAGPSVRPMTYPIEPDLAESWTQTNDTTYVFKLKKGVRWHPKPPVNGRELTADDVKYTYERFLTITGNPNKPVLEYVDRIEAVDKHTVKFTLKEPNAWFLDLLASTSTWIVAKECVEKFGDLKKVESVVGTGPWMLERWEPNVKLVYVRNPNYFVPGLPYADGVDMLIDKDPSSRLATWLSGKTDFGPEYQHAVRWLDAPLARQRKPGLQTAEYTWFTSGATGFKLANPPFGDLRVRRALGRATNVAEVYESLAFSQGHWTPNPIVPAAFAEWSIPIDQLGPEGKKLYEFNTAEAKRLLAEAGHPNGFKTTVEAPAAVYGPDFDDSVAITIKNWKAAGIEARPEAQGVRGVHLEHHLRQVRRHVHRAARRLGRPRGVLLPLVHARPAAERLGRQRPQAHRHDQAPATDVRRRQAQAGRVRHPAVPRGPGAVRPGRIDQGPLRVGRAHQELHAEQRLRLRRAADGRLDRQVEERPQRVDRRPAPPCATTFSGDCWSRSRRC